MSSPAKPIDQLGERPSTRPRADLAGAFGPPDHAGNLAGRLAHTPPSGGPNG